MDQLTQELIKAMDKISDAIKETNSQLEQLNGTLDSIVTMTTTGNTYLNVAALTHEG